MGIIQLIKDLNRTKRLSKRELTPPVWLLSWVTGLFQPSDSRLKYQLFLGLAPAQLPAVTHTINSPDSQTFGPGLELHISSLESSPCRPQTLGIFSLLNGGSQYLIIHLIIHTHTPLLVLFLWRTLTNINVYSSILSIF